MSRKFKKSRSSPVKIAYYVQRILENDVDYKEVILILSSLFNKEDLKRFADKYRYCSKDDIRYIANYIYSHNCKKF